MVPLPSLSQEYSETARKKILREEHGAPLECFHRRREKDWHDRSWLNGEQIAKRGSFFRSIEKGVNKHGIEEHDRTDA